MTIRWLFSRPSMSESADGGIVSALQETLLYVAVLPLGLPTPAFPLGTAIVLAARPVHA